MKQHLGKLRLSRMPVQIGYGLGVVAGMSLAVLLVGNAAPNFLHVGSAVVLEICKAILFVATAVGCHRLYKSEHIVGWRLISIASMIWVPGQLVLAYLSLTNTHGNVDLTSVDAFALTALPLAIVGVAMIGLHGLEAKERIHIILNSISFGSCIAFVGIVYIVSTFGENSSLAFDKQVSNFIAFTLDITFISLVAAICLYRRFDKVFLPLGIGLIVQALGDVYFIVNSFHGVQIEVVWRTTQLLSAMAWCYAATRKAGRPTKQGTVQGEIHLTIGVYATVSVVLIFAMTQISIAENINHAVLYSFMTMFITVLAAQLVSYFENKRLQKEQLQSIEEISRSEERFQDLATHDTLTHLSNRTFFIERLDAELLIAQRKNEPLAVLFIDLDRFKEINDTFGHSIGDFVIKSLSERISNVVGQSGVVCRLGGDEFAVLLPSPAQRDFTFDIASRILRASIEPVDIEGQETYLTCSVGIAYSEHEMDAQSILRNADAAMYRAKELGRNRIEYAEEVIKPARVINGWSLSDLHRAIVQDEIDVYYQSIVDMETNEIVSFEALARWRHPFKGSVPPEDFIAVAEDNGLIIELGDIVLRKTLAQMHAWDHKYGRDDIRMNINLSLRQLNDAHFMKDLLEYCTQWSIHPSRIVFEMTESSLLGDARTALATLNDIKNQGFELCIDDFGTGYSSLSYLKKFPVTSFKIDQSFVQGYGHDENDSAIVKALISLAESMGMAVTAEGVQSVATRDALKELGCTYAQGYFYSEAEPAENITLTSQKIKKISSAKLA